VCCSVLQYVAACCSMLQYVAVCCTTYFLKGKKASRVGTVLRSPMAGTSRLLKDPLLRWPEASIEYMPDSAMGWNRSAANASDTATCLPPNISR